MSSRTKKQQPDWRQNVAIRNQVSWPMELPLSPQRRRIWNLKHAQVFNVHLKWLTFQRSVRSVRHCWPQLLFSMPEAFAFCSPHLFILSSNNNVTSTDVTRLKKTDAFASEYSSGTSFQWTRLCRVKRNKHSQLARNSSYIYDFNIQNLIT